MNQTKKESINPFLESITRSSGSDADKSPKVEQKVSLKLISIIPRNGSTPVARLLQESNLSVVDFANALTAIQNAGLIEIKGSGTDQVAELTDVGAKLASIV